MVLDFSLAFIFLGKTVKTHSCMVSATMQRTSLSTVESVADVMWNFKWKQCAGQIPLTAATSLSGHLPCLSLLLFQCWQTPARHDFQKRYGFASQMMSLASVPYFPWSILLVVQVLPETCYGSCDKCQQKAQVLILAVMRKGEVSLLTTFLFCSELHLRFRFLRLVPAELILC